jgi:hypothetical protein
LKALHRNRVSTSDVVSFTASACEAQASYPFVVVITIPLLSGHSLSRIEIIDGPGSGFFHVFGSLLRNGCIDVDAGANFESCGGPDPGNELNVPV